MSTPKYIAIAGPEGELSLVVSVSHEIPGGYAGHVVNGGWRGEFANGTVYVDARDAGFPGAIVWQGNRLEYAGGTKAGRGDDCGFGYVRAEIAAGRGVPA